MRGPFDKADGAGFSLSDGLWKFHPVLEIIEKHFCVSGNNNIGVSFLESQWIYTSSFLDSKTFLYEISKGPLSWNELGIGLLGDIEDETEIQFRIWTTHN